MAKPIRNHKIEFYYTGNSKTFTLHNVVMIALLVPMKRLTRNHKNQMYRLFTYFMFSGLKCLNIFEWGYDCERYIHFKTLSEGVASIVPRPWDGPEGRES